MREAGILLSVSSLPSRWGIGSLDSAAYEWIDQMAKAGQSLWQILPIGPTGYGDSPYQAFSTFAGNPYYISLEALIQENLLTEEECKSAGFGENPGYVDYGALYRGRMSLLRKAYERCGRGEAEVDAFVRENADWLPTYALFMALKDAHSGASWTQWEPELALRQPEAIRQAEESCADDIRFQEYVQYLFFHHFQKVMDYAHSRGIRIIGDIPIYVSADSADAWSQPELFQLDEAHRPVSISGCPPDAFAKDGQLWGNPLYDWKYHAKTGYSWWIRRIRHCFRTCDILRIDHFRGFDEYYSIPAGAATAAGGHWEKGPGIALFEAITAALGKREIIAEDLGYVTDSVRRLVRDTGYGGIKVFEFAFDSRDTGAAEDYLPDNYPENCAAYTGTHDNAPLTEWFDEITGAEREKVRAYIHSDLPADQLYWPMIESVMNSAARIAVIPMQDYLGLGREARMNQPSTFGSNWQWRLLPGEFTPELAERIRSLTIRSGRGEGR